jgi:hypothetical protein
MYVCMYVQGIHKRMVRYQKWIKENRTILLCMPCICMSPLQLQQGATALFRALRVTYKDIYLFMHFQGNSYSFINDLKCQEMPKKVYLPYIIAFYEWVEP